MATLKEFLESEEEKLRNEQADALAEREEWIASVGRLMARITDWLGQADPKHVLPLDDTPLRVVDRILGNYEIPALIIGMGTRAIHVKPVAPRGLMPVRVTGRYPVPRAYGCVDMTNGVDRYMIFRTQKDPDDRWTIVEQAGSLVKPLDQETFESVLKSLLE